MKKDFSVFVAERQLTCGVCRGEIKKGEHYTVRSTSSSGKNSMAYAVPLHLDCESLLQASFESRVAA